MFGAQDPYGLTNPKFILVGIPDSSFAASYERSKSMAPLHKPS